MGSPQSKSAGSNSPDAEPKKSLYQRYHDKKDRTPIKDEDILKYTGKTREELNAWAETQPGVGKNQLAGRIDVGPASGLGGLAVADGYGGWGADSNPQGPSRGMKFPPEREQQEERKEKEKEKEKGLEKGLGG
ncbi:hypothetical protein QQS21_009935 [Conoideocrella luteorostrata]|uniref:Uncharacterized protein n=1 Tax=Conoideocrella luteorostrata TaxID=1105319 RepID=A0AAJ0CFZ3_9HYPO|nr:hypothetical protein QQS21_009935 [Conoideocrella luteorostrata]